MSRSIQPPKIDQTWYTRPADVPERTSAGGVVLRRHKGRWHIALAREGDYPGYVLPKGGVAAGESFEAAARREIEEEAGLGDLTYIAPLGSRSRLTFSRKRWVTVHYFLFITKEAGGRPTDTAKHIHPPAWFALDALPPNMLWPEQRELIETNRDRILALVKGIE